MFSKVLQRVSRRVLHNKETNRVTNRVTHQINQSIKVRYMSTHNMYSFFKSEDGYTINLNIPKHSISKEEAQELKQILSKVGFQHKIKSVDSLDNDTNVEVIKVTIETDSMIYRMYQIIASIVATGTVLYINDVQNTKTQLFELIVPSICGFVAPLTTTLICGSYLVYHKVYKQQDLQIKN